MEDIRNTDTSMTAGWKALKGNGTLFIHNSALISPLRGDMANFGQEVFTIDLQGLRVILSRHLGLHHS